MLRQPPSRPRTSALLLVLLVLALTAVTLTGCSATTGQPSPEDSMTVGYGKGPMEDAIARMKKMRTEIIRALNREIEHKHWAPIVNQDGASIAGCNDGVSETVALLIYGTDDTYPPGRWQDAAAIVERIGRTYGFDEVNRTVDKPGNLDMTGLAPDGGSYSFGMEKAMDLSVQTGCYKWKHHPGPDAWQTIDPTPGE